MSDANRYWIGTGWKMNKTLSESLDYADTLTREIQLLDKRINTFVIPPFTSVRQVKERLADTSILVGAQNMHWAEEGAWTGEISPRMLSDCNLDLVELGHSERRSYFAESDEAVGLKTEAAIRAGLTPLICIGETLEDRDDGIADAVLMEQVSKALSQLSDIQKRSEIMLAYEPRWAIGVNGTPATPEYTNARHKVIIETARTILSRDVPCLYGGSVDRKNCQAIIQCSCVNGLFIGRAAWDIDEFLEILSLCEAVI